MGIKKNGKDEADLVNSVLLRSQLNGNGATTVQTFVSQRTGGAPKIEADDISYGEAVNIDINNLDDLGLDNDIVTYGMDEDGNFFTELEDGMDMDFDERAPEDFLFDMSGGSNSMSSTMVDGEIQYEGLEEENFWLRRVEKEGETIGYLVTGEEDSQYGFYMGIDEIDYANLPEEMRNTLSRPEPLKTPENDRAPVSPEAKTAPEQAFNVLQPF